MTEPTHLEDSATFDLDAVVRSLRTDAGYARDGHAARTLLRQPDLRVVLIALRAGSAIKEHRAHETASIQALAGRVRLTLREGRGAREVELGRGQLLALAPDLPHDVHALEDSALVLTLGWRS